MEIFNIMKGFTSIAKSKSYKAEERTGADIYQYLIRLMETGEYLYLIKRITKIGVYSALISSYYWTPSIEIEIKRLKITKDIYKVIEELGGLPSSITNYLWSRGEEFNEIRERLIKKDVKGLILDIDRYNVGLFNDSIIRGR